MEIKHTFHPSDIPHTARKIHSYIQQEKKLTNRSLQSITSMLKTSSLYICYVDDAIVGFIGKVLLTNGYYELQSLYVLPAFRGKSIAETLLVEILQDNNTVFIASTYQKGIIKLLARHGFQETTIVNLPPTVLLRYLTTRSLRSILEHVFVHRFQMLIKKI